MSKADPREFGFEVYANDEPNDLNPGIIVDSREWVRGPYRALTVEQARALAQAINDVADYMEEKQQ